jgi:hypothetical protein
MSDNGLRPAYNVEFATDTESGAIVGVEVVTTGDDRTQLVPMMEQIQERYGISHGERVANVGFATHENITKLSDAPYYTTVYCPVPTRRTGPRTEIPPVSLADSLMPQRPIPGSTDAVTKWRVRMATDEAKEIYKLRCQTAEWVNTMARSRGLHQFPVRGLIKVKAVALWQAVTHNLFCAKRLMGKLAAAAIH